MKPPRPHHAEGAEGADIAPVVSTVLPPELMQAGELVILLIKPSVWYILLGSLRSLGFILVLTFIALQLSILFDRNDVIVVATGLVIVRLFWQFLDWFNRWYVLTDRRLLRVKGVVQVEVFETSLKNIQHTELLCSLRERLFGLGTICFATSGTAFTEAYWHMVARPLDVHQTVVKTIERYR